MKNYNIINLSIENGLKIFAIGTAGGYIKLLYAPTNANVKIHLNERNADGIPLKAYHSIEATDIERIFVSADAVAGGAIQIVQANTTKDFKMSTPASDVTVSSITEIINPVQIGVHDEIALSQLNKIINPYNFTGTINGKSNSTSNVVLLDIIADFDKLQIFLSRSGLDLYDVSNYWNWHGIYFVLDSVVVTNAQFSANVDTSTKSNIELDNIRGKHIQIISRCADTKDFVYYTIQKYTLK